MSLKTKPFEESLNCEYDMLREELLVGMSIRNTLLTFMITTTIAILSFAITKESIVISALAFCVIFPMSRRIVDNYDGMARASAYMMAYLESQMSNRKWETRLYDIKGNTRRIRYPEGAILSIVTYAVFLILFHNEGISTWFDCVHCVLPIGYIAYEIWIACRTRNFRDHQRQWKEKWEKQAGIEEKTTSEEE